MLMVIFIAYHVHIIYILRGSLGEGVLNFSSVTSLGLPAVVVARSQFSEVHSSVVFRRSQKRVEP